MKPEEQIKALAELDGWTNLEHEVHPAITYEWAWRDGEKHIIPPYLTSYDAIIPVVQRQTYETRQLIIRWLIYRVGDHYFLSTPSQLCEALLRATENWKE